jgi:hypothetical protein
MKKHQRDKEAQRKPRLANADAQPLNVTEEFNFQLMKCSIISPPETDGSISELAVVPTGRCQQRGD